MAEKSDSHKFTRLQKLQIYNINYNSKIKYLDRKFTGFLALLFFTFFSLQESPVYLLLFQPPFLFFPSNLFSLSPFSPLHNPYCFLKPFSVLRMFCPFFLPTSTSHFPLLSSCPLHIFPYLALVHNFF